MANRKLKSFEYANHTDVGKVNDFSSDIISTFEGPNGYGFVVCDGDDPSEYGRNAAELAAERIEYYLANEFVDDPQQAVYNALVYANGFIYEFSRKNNEYQGVGIHCSFLLLRDEKAWFSSLGSTKIFFFNGKKLCLISAGEAKGNEDEYADSDTDILLGQQQNIQPIVNAEALIPLNEDAILLCTDGFLGVPEKQIMKVLSDPMPLQTKVYRLIDLANQYDGEDNTSLQLVSFYNLEHTQRYFAPIEGKKRKPKPTKTRTSSKTEMNGSTEFAEETKGNYTFSNPWVKYGVIGLAAILVLYMFYDLFIHDPRPAEKIVIPSVQQVDKEQKQEKEKEIPKAEEEQSAALPADRTYNVKRGDTWGAIYREFGVCSWFIRNHADNAGKLNREENPVAGTTLKIPVAFSAKRSLNPDFYQDFTTDKTGSRCENANEDFIHQFKQKRNIP